MALTTRDLFEIAGLKTDGVSGFFAQCRSKYQSGKVLWPEHLRDKRLATFREGAGLARDWMAMQRGYALARRKRRAKHFQEDGATSCLLPEGADRRNKQLHCLREGSRFRAGTTPAAASNGDCERRGKGTGEHEERSRDPKGLLPMFYDVAHRHDQALDPS
jgi:hypothetical protein